MSRKSNLKKVISVLSKPPDQQVIQVADFAEFLLERHEAKLLTHGIQQLTVESGAFDFLYDEEDLYSVNDLRDRYD